ncbi:bifunctional hydroxymethylpyrimidine kinase/phosphomethylpyrimidine kinase [Rhodobacteraceae bacterium NNCM2]|nr:bifunctional hydroxymethylpyrimidine kinase/phosphomethylpyrimidine kinase [Coraliihabitans acroporae]
MFPNPANLQGVRTLEGAISVDQQAGHTPIALTIAGSDSGGGAGIQADLKAFSALGVFGASVITALTAQNTRAVTAVENVSPPMIAAQIEAVFDDLAVDAVKIGMLSSPRIIETVADGLAGRDVPVILDPVMVAKSGAVLLEDAAVETLIARLLPLARLATPNLPEAAKLLGAPVAETPEEMAEQAKALIAKGARAVLMKGGHAEGDVCTDLLVLPDAAPISFSAPRLQTRNTHGTGCTLSSAIAAGVAKGLDLPDAVAEAHAYLHAAIEAADSLHIGHGHGPVHHFHRQWGAS